MSAPNKIYIADPEIHPDPNRKGFISALPERGAVHTVGYIRADIFEDMIDNAIADERKGGIHVTLNEI